MQLAIFGKNYRWDETKLSKKQKFDFLCLNITRRCNLNCFYCFAKSYEDKEDMSFEIAKLAIDKYLSTVNKLCFFGGEPLLNFALIYDVVNYMNKFKKKSFSITTNATLINDEIAEFLLRNSFSMIISLDGTEEIHNSCRKNQAGEGSYSKVIEGLQTLRKIADKLKIKNLPITLRSTFSDFMNINLLSRMTFLQSLIEKNLATNYSIEPIHSFFYPLSKKEKINIEQSYKICADLFIENAKKNKFYNFFHITKPLDRILSNQNFATECGAGIGMLDIAVDGKIYPCHREEAEDIGNLQDGIDLEKQKAWEKRHMLQKKNCSSCWNRNICGGGCRMNSLTYGLDILEQNPNECFFKKLFTKVAVYILNNLSEENIFYFINRNKDINKIMLNNILKNNKTEILNLKEIFANFSYKDKENILNNNFYCEFCK